MKRIQPGIAAFLIFDLALCIGIVIAVVMKG